MQTAARHDAMCSIGGRAPVTARPARRAPVAPRAAQKGFGGGGDGQRGGQQVKVSKRGKLASRPSPERQLKQLQESEAAYLKEIEARNAERQAAGQAPAARVDTDATTSGSSAEAIPQVVSDRMLRRIVVCAGTPVFLGLTLFPLFYWIKVKQGIDLPTWVVYLVQTLTFGGGLAGITYGAMSASWDPRREGSLLGWTEFRANLPLLLDRFRKP